jgi:hypothetical protein
MKITLCIPHNYPEFQKPFVMSLLGVISSFYLHKNEEDILNILIQNAGPIDFMRERLVESAIKQNADFILFLDTDMDFPPDIINKMLGHFKTYENIEAITGLYTWKQPPFMPHVYPKLTENGKFTIGALFPLDKPFDVEGAGMGCVMIKKQVFDRTPQPWFKMELGDKGISVGEDLYFFRKTTPLMLCDPTISCGHFTENRVDINSYLSYNGYTDEGGAIYGTEKQIKEASDEHCEKVSRLKS